MDKQLIVDFLIENISSELSKAQSALESTNSYKSSGDMKQEGKYDTRAIEAGYLAGAQQKRVKELEIELSTLKNMNPEVLKAKKMVSIGSVVEVETQSGVYHYFISPAGGGLTFQNISIITNSSPMGSELMQLEVGETFELETPSGNREFEILSIL